MLNYPYYQDEGNSSLLYPRKYIVLFRYPLALFYGYVSGIRQIPSPYCDGRPATSSVTLLVIHNISLPPKQYEGSYIVDLFTGTLDRAVHPYFEQLHDLKVSCHFLIRRSGEIIQFVSCSDCAWHAGISVFEGQRNCNYFSIGIELEGCDDEPFMKMQYVQLAKLTLLLAKHYPIQNIVGHSDIAPQRKTDPGPHFNWDYYSDLMRQSDNGID